MHNRDTSGHCDDGQQKRGIAVGHHTSHSSTLSISSAADVDFGVFEEELKFLIFCNTEKIRNYYNMRIIVCVCNNQSTS